MRVIFRLNRKQSRSMRRYARREMEYAPGKEKEGWCDMTDLLTADEMAQRLRVRPATVKTWARSGRIPTVRLSPKVIRYDAEAVVAALTAQAAPGPREGRRS